MEHQKKFVRYRFPKAVNSLYANDFCKKQGKKLVGGKQSPFSNELEWAKLTNSTVYPLAVNQPKNIVDEE